MSPGRFFELCCNFSFGSTGRNDDGDMGNTVLGKDNQRSTNNTDNSNNNNANKPIVDGGQLTYLELLLDLVCIFFAEPKHRSNAAMLESLLETLQYMSIATGDAIVTYMPRIIPTLTEMLSGRLPVAIDGGGQRATMMSLIQDRNRVINAALSTVRILGPALLSHIHLIMSPLMQLIERTVFSIKLRVHALDTLFYLMNAIDVSAHLGTVLHVLLHACRNEISAKQTSPDDAFLSLEGEPLILWPTAIVVLQQLKQSCNSGQSPASYALSASISHTISKIQESGGNAAGWNRQRCNNAIMTSQKRLREAADRHRDALATRLLNAKGRDDDAFDVQCLYNTQ